MKTVNIPGGSATLRDKEDTKQRHKRLVQSAAIAAAPLLSKLPEDVAERESMTEAEVMALAANRQEVESLFELQDATIVALLMSWTLPDPLPDMDTIGDLDPEVYEALSKAVSSLGSQLQAESFDPVAPDSKEFEASPTDPSSDSDNGSRGVTALRSVPVPPSSGTSTDSGVSSPD